MIVITFYSHLIPAWIFYLFPSHIRQKTYQKTPDISEIIPCSSVLADTQCVPEVQDVSVFHLSLYCKVGLEYKDPVPPACEEETGNCVWILVNPDSLCDSLSFIFIKWQTKNQKIFHWWHFSVILSYGNFVLCIDVHTEDAEWLLFEIQICLIHQKGLFIFMPQIRFKNKSVCKTKKILLAAHRK